MPVRCFLSCWGNQLSLPEAIEKVRPWGYDGVEGPPSKDAKQNADSAAMLKSMQMPFIAEIATGGDYVPLPHQSADAHLDDFRVQLERVSVFAPVLVNVLGGSDRWSMAECVSFYVRAIGHAKRMGLKLVWETHRSRPTATPWRTEQLLKEIPEMQLNCDFSHWCVVCERLILNEEPSLLRLCASRADHVHLRVGHAQGPQISDPRLPEHREAVDAHFHWWQQLNVATATPEFGPDGYGSRESNLVAINQWMASAARERLASGTETAA